MNKAELSQWKTNPGTKEVFTKLQEWISELSNQSLNEFDWDNPYKVHATNAYKLGKIDAYVDILNLEAEEEEENE